MKPQTLIKTLRKKLNLTQLALSEAVGVDRINICKYERGKTMPPGDVLLRIIDYARERGVCNFTY